MKRAILVGALLGGLGASGCVIREVRVGDDGNEGGQGGAAGAAGSAGGVTTAWGCLDQAPPPLTNEIVNLQLELSDATDRRPRTDAVVRACSRFDQDCATPIGAPVQVDAFGKATLQVPQDFNGYLEVFGPQGPEADDPEFVRTLVFFSPREIARGAVGRGIFVFSEELIRNLAIIGGGSFDNQTGLSILTALDCEGTLAAEVSYEVLSENLTTELTSQYYTIDRVPLTGVSETDASGTGGFTNLKPGLVSFAASVNVKGQGKPLTGDAGVGAFTRAGWYTQVYVAP